MLNPFGPRSRVNRPAASTIRARVARTSSRRVGLMSSSLPEDHGVQAFCTKSCSQSALQWVSVGITYDPARSSDVDGAVRPVDGDLELTVEHLFEKITAPASAPHLEFGIVVRLQTEHDEVLTHKRLEIVHSLPPPPIQAVRDPQNRGRTAQTLAIFFVERPEARLGALRIAPPMMADQRGQERDFARFEPPKLTVLDEVCGVALVAFA